MSIRRRAPAPCARAPRRDRRHLRHEPVVVAAPDGTPYVSALQHLYVSTNGGTSWSKVTTLIYASVGRFAGDFVDATIDSRGVAHLVWMTDGGAIRYAAA